MLEKLSALVGRLEIITGKGQGRDIPIETLLVKDLHGR